MCWKKNFSSTININLYFKWATTFWGFFRTTPLFKQNKTKKSIYGVYNILLKKKLSILKIEKVTAILLKYRSQVLIIN